MVGGSKRSHKHFYNQSGVAIIIGGDRSCCTLVYATSSVVHVFRTCPKRADSAGRIGKKCHLKWSETKFLKDSRKLNKSMECATHALLETEIVLFILLFFKVYQVGALQFKKCINQICKCYRGTLEKIVQESGSYKGSGALQRKWRLTKEVKALQRKLGLTKEVGPYKGSGDLTNEVWPYKGSGSLGPSKEMEALHRNWEPYKGSWSLTKEVGPYKGSGGLTKEVGGLQRKWGPYKGNGSLTKEMGALQRKWEPYKGSGSLTKEVGALQRKWEPYKGSGSLTKEVGPYTQDEDKAVCSSPGLVGLVSEYCSMCHSNEE